MEQQKGSFICGFYSCNQRNNFLKKNRRGQIWIETVIYTSIAFVMIALVLAYAKPKVEEIQDRAIIEQSIKILEEIDNVISNVKIASGNQRIIELDIKKGSLKIDGINDKIIFELEGRCEYSEPEKDISVGDIIIRTEEKGELNLVTLTKDYSGTYGILYQNKDEEKSITKSPTPYKLLISNTVGGINIEIN